MLAFYALTALAADPAPAPAAPAPAPIVAPDCTKAAATLKTQCETLVATAVWSVATPVVQQALVDRLALGDCAALTGDAKTTCDGKATALNATLDAYLATLPQKGGKASRSTSNRMESETNNE